MPLYETHARTLAKTIVWRVVATLITWSALYLFTGEFEKSAEVTGAAALVSMAAYYLHERIWNSVRWGRVEVTK